MVSATMVPFICTLPVLLMWAYHYNKEQQFSHTLAKERRALKMNTISLLLSITYFFLPSASMAIFAVFPCDYMDDDRMFLKNDYQISCDPDNVEHNGYLVYASIMTCLFPVGIPALYIMLLWKDRKILNPDPKRKGNETLIIDKREKTPEIQHTIFLWGSYRPNAWWFEIFECVRRILLTGALVFVQQGSQTQVALGTLICITCGIIFALVWPYATYRDNVLGMLSHCQLIGTLFSAMMFKLGKNADSAYDQEASGWLLITLNGVVFLIMFFWVSYEVMVEEGPGLRSREKQFMAQASFIISGGKSRFDAEGEDVESRDPRSKTEVSGPGVELKVMNSGRKETLVEDMGINPMRNGRATLSKNGSGGIIVGNVETEPTRHTALSSLTSYFGNSFRRSAATSRAASSRAASSEFEIDHHVDKRESSSTDDSPPPLPSRGPPLPNRGPPLPNRGPPVPTRGPPVPTRGPPTLTTIVSSVHHHDSVGSNDTPPQRPGGVRFRSNPAAVVFAPTPSNQLHSANSWGAVENGRGQKSSEDSAENPEQRDEGGRASSFAVNGWVRIWSDGDQAYYYHNESTGETSWDVPG
jgi:hypothetical protein